MRKIITGLSPGQKYLAQFRSIAGDEVSEWSQILSFETTNDLVAPAKITGLTGAAVEKNFRLTWNAPTTNVDGSPLTDFKDYRITVETGGIVRTYYTSATSFDFTYDQNVSAFTTPRPSFKFSVAARDNSLNTNSDQASVTVTNAFPVAATNFALLSVTDALRFTWTPTTDKDVALYRVYKGNTNTTTSEKIYEGAAPQFLYATQDYSVRYFRLSTVDNFGQETFTSNVLQGAPGKAGNDTTPPANPEWVTNWYTIETDLSNPYVLRKDVTLRWIAAVDTDFNNYVVSYRRAGASAFSQVVSFTNTARLENLSPNTMYEVSLASVDRAGNRSAFIPAPEQLDTGRDTEPLPKPSTPVTGNYVGQMTVAWDGKTTSNANMPSDFSHVAVHASTSKGFTVTPTNFVGRMSTNGSSQRIIVGGLTFGSTYYVKFVAYDYSGNSSTPSDEATGSPKLINGSDIQNASINSAQISSLEAGKITTGELSSDTRILAGPELDTHAELTGTGLRIFGKTLDILDENGNVTTPGTLREVIRLGTSSSDYFGIISEDGQTLAGINEIGEGTFQNLITNQLSVGGESLEEILDRKAGKLVGRYARSFEPRPRIYQVERGLVEFYAPIRGGIEYTVYANFQMNASTGDKSFEVFLRQSLDGRSPTTTSRVIGQRVYTNTGNTSDRNVPIDVIGRVFSPVDTTARILCSAIASAGSVALDNRLAMFDIREEGPLSSIKMGGSSDGAYTDPNNGGTVTPTPPPSSEEPNPEPIKVTTTRRYQSTWTGMYQGDNARIKSVEFGGQGQAQGDRFSNGNKRSLYGFPEQIVNDLAGAEINSMRLFLQAGSAVSNTGTRTRIGAHGSVNRPENTMNGLTVYVERLGRPLIRKGQGIWVRIPTDSFASWKNGTFKGIMIGPGSSSDPLHEILFKGASEVGAPILEITYTK